MNDIETFIKEITKKAGEITLEKFGKVGVLSTKKHILDIVTEADLLSNAFLEREIKKKYPDHGIISEELGKYNTNAEYVWIIDPLDGTLNFSKQIPFYAVLVGLKKGDTMEMGCVYQPVSGDLYFARKGKGAFLNGKKIRCSPQRTLVNSIGLMNDLVKKERLQSMNRLLDTLEGGRCNIRIFASIGLSCAYVADGREDWYVSHEGAVWDYAAATLIAQEAGCTVTDFDGNPWNVDTKKMIIANKQLHAQLFKMISGMKDN